MDADDGDDDDAEAREAKEGPMAAPPPAPAMLPKTDDDAPNTDVDGVDF